jgi:hypothetical protein
MYADVYQRELSRWVQEREAKEMEDKHHLLMPKMAAEDTVTNQEGVGQLLANPERFSQPLTNQERSCLLLTNQEQADIEAHSTSQVTANMKPSIKDTPDTGGQKEADPSDDLREAVSNLRIGEEKEMSNQSSKKHENWGRQRIVSGLGLILNQLKGSGEGSDMQQGGRLVNYSHFSRVNLLQISTQVTIT